MERAWNTVATDASEHFAPQRSNHAAICRAIARVDFRAHCLHETMESGAAHGQATLAPAHLARAKGRLYVALALSQDRVLITCARPNADKLSILHFAPTRADLADPHPEQNGLKALRQWTAASTALRLCFAPATEARPSISDLRRALGCQTRDVGLWMMGVADLERQLFGLHRDGWLAAASTSQLLALCDKESQSHGALAALLATVEASRLDVLSLFFSDMLQCDPMRVLTH